MSRSWWASKTEGVGAPPAVPHGTLQPRQFYLGPRAQSREEHSSPHVGPLRTRAWHAPTASAQARRHPSIARIEAQSCAASPAPRPRAGGFWVAPAHWPKHTQACCAHSASSEGVHRQQRVGPASAPWSRRCMRRRGVASSRLSPNGPRLSPSRGTASRAPLGVKVLAKLAGSDTLGRNTATLLAE